MLKPCDTPPPCGSTTPGIDTSVIALWLGHEQIATTGIHLHADLVIKQQALDRTRLPDIPAGRYQPDDALLTWLTNL